MNAQKPINFFCPICARKIIADSSQAGRSISCPKCGGQVSVPGQQAASGPRPAQPTPRSPRNPYDVKKLILVGVGVVTLIAGISTTVLLLKGGKNIDDQKGGKQTISSPQDLPAGCIASLQDEKKISNGVGLVFNAWDIVDKNGLAKETPFLPYVYTESQFSELPDEIKKGMRQINLSGSILYIEMVLGSAGSCFLVTPDGYAITNKHVVEEFDRITKANTKRTNMREKLKLEKADPILLVYFAGKEHKATVKFVHSKIDFAIIKIQGIKDAPYFSLDASEEIKRGEEVIALGFPGIAREELPGEEGEAALRVTNVKIKGGYLPEVAFGYSQTPGSISAKQDRTIGRLIVHTAAVNPGNSGGPLVDANGKVLGINTFAAVGRGTYWSVQMKQLQDEIDQYIPDVVWQKEPAQQ